MFPTGTALTARVMRMSQLRKRILAVLPLSPEAPMPTGEVMERMGISRPSNAERAAISRSLARSAEHGLVLRWHAEIRLSGNGNLWSRAKQQTENSGKDGR